MSAREWKPGDVAVISTSADISWRAIVRERKEAAGRALVFAYVTGGFDMVDDLAEGYTARPLVVIDPEDEDAVDHLIDILWGDRDPSNRPATWRIQERLRGFVNPKPPKPDEPTGLGAVVEDAMGRKWVRIGADEDPGDEFLRTQMSPPWRSRGKSAKWWQSLDAVRVLSEGVTA